MLNVMDRGDGTVHRRHVDQIHVSKPLTRPSFSASAPASSLTLPSVQPTVPATEVSQQLIEVASDDEIGDRTLPAIDLTDEPVSPPRFAAPATPRATSPPAATNYNRRSQRQRTAPLRLGDYDVA